MSKVMKSVIFNPDPPLAEGTSMRLPLAAEVNASEKDADADPMLERLHMRLSQFSITLGVLALVMLAVNQIFFIGR